MKNLFENGLVKDLLIHVGHKSLNNKPERRGNPYCQGLPLLSLDGHSAIDTDLDVDTNIIADVDIDVGREVGVGVEVER